MALAAICGFVLDSIGGKKMKAHLIITQGENQETLMLFTRKSDGKKKKNVSLFDNTVYCFDICFSHYSIGISIHGESLSLYI